MPNRAMPSAPVAAPAPAGFNLLRWFGVLGLVCVIATGAGSAWLLSRFLTEHMLRRDAEVSSEFVDSIVRAERTWSYFVRPDSAEARERLEGFFNHVARLPGVVRANVYGPDRTVLWSSDAALIGQRFGANHELEEALRGEVAVEAGEVPKDEHVALDAATGGRRFVESYLPVRSEDRRRIIGVVEIYRVPEALFRSIDAGVRLIWFAAAASALLLYAALVGLALRAQRVMTRQQDLLVEGEALSAVGAVASAVAHGVRNPLASIRSSAELAAQEDQDGLQECLRDIQQEVDRLDAWVRDLLLQARGEAEATGPVDVNLLLAATARSFAASAARQRVEVVVETAAVPRVRATAAALSQALDNLVANAIEAMPEGGLLLLRSAMAPGARGVQVTVTDSGTGLPKELRGAAGRLFWSSKARGSGLGLVLTRRILARQQGALALETAPGGGTRAVISLPVAG